MTPQTGAMKRLACALPRQGYRAHQGRLVGQQRLTASAARRVQKDLPNPPRFWAGASVPAGLFRPSAKYNNTHAQPKPAIPPPGITSPHDSAFPSHRLHQSQFEKPTQTEPWHFRAVDTSRLTQLPCLSLLCRGLRQSLRNFGSGKKGPTARNKSSWELGPQTAVPHAAFSKLNPIRLNAPRFVQLSAGLLQLLGTLHRDWQRTRTERRVKRRLSSRRRFQHCQTPGRAIARWVFQPAH